jgi:CBS domain-containing protein
MQVRDIMTARVVSCPPNATVAEAAACMRDEKVGSILIVDETVGLVGLLTDRQITHTAVADGLDPNNVEVGDIMFTDFVPLEPDMDLLVAVRLQKELAMRRLPVLENNVPIGIVSTSDISAFVKECIDAILVEGEVRVLKRRARGSAYQPVKPRAASDGDR